MVVRREWWLCAVLHCFSCYSATLLLLLRCYFCYSATLVPPNCPGHWSTGLCYLCYAPTCATLIPPTSPNCSTTTDQLKLWMWITTKLGTVTWDEKRETMHRRKGWKGKEANFYLCIKVLEVVASHLSCKFHRPRVDKKEPKKNFLTSQLSFLTMLHTKTLKVN